MKRTLRKATKSLNGFMDLEKLVQCRDFLLKFDHSKSSILTTPRNVAAPSKYERIYAFALVEFR